MKAKVNYGRIQVELEAPSQLELVKQIAACDEVFYDNTCRAKINDNVLESNNVIFRHRVTNEGHHYLYKECVENRQDGELWKLKGFRQKLGQYQGVQQGTLFTNRKPTEGEIPGYNGWSKYVKENNGGGQSNYGGGNNRNYNSSSNQGGGNQGNGGNNYDGGNQPQPQQDFGDDVPF